jgi:hypothetical protein
MDEDVVTLLAALGGAVAGGSLSILGGFLAARHEQRRAAQLFIFERLPEVMMCLEGMADRPYYADRPTELLDTIRRKSVLAGGDALVHCKELVSRHTRWLDFVDQDHVREQDSVGTVKLKPVSQIEHEQRIQVMLSTLKRLENHLESKLAGSI